MQLKTYALKYLRTSDPAEIEPQHLAPNDAMVFHQTIRTCAPEEVSDETEITVAVTYRDGITFASGSQQLTSTFSEMVAAQSPLLHKGAAIYAYAEGLKTLRTTSNRAAVLQEMMGWIERAEAHNPGDADLTEIRRVIESL